MGLSVSQVRLLALTNRKADIELRMQVNTKRKMMLTRKSTELAQQYYSRLQCSNIQYATTAGYEDVNYDYLMGETEGGKYTDEFIQGIAIASSKTVKKPQNNMVLIDEQGRVIVNDFMARIIEKARDDDSGKKNSERVANAILDIVENYKTSVLNSAESITDKTAAAFIYGSYCDGDQIDKSKKDMLMQNMALMIKNGGFKSGGVVYIAADTTDAPTGSPNCYGSQEEAVADTGENRIPLEKGSIYQVRNKNGYLCSSEAFYGVNGFSTNLSVQTAKYLGNLIDYFAPIISAGLQNGISSRVVKKPIWEDSEVQFSGKIDETTSKEDIMQAIGLMNNDGSFNFGGFVNEQVFKVNDGDGNYYYKAIKYAVPAPTEAEPDKTEDRWRIVSASSGDYYTYETSGEYYKLDENGDRVLDEDGNEIKVTGDNSIFRAAKNVDNLQSRFKSGLCQLAMVTDVTRGTYHKNTTMNYFTHMNYVVERTDTSKKEELTAWFNAEQAQISEQETYWDSEIQNLSTELSSVNTEIQSVKQLKSDSIKSVFNWGEG